MGDDFFIIRNVLTVLALTSPLILNAYFFGARGARVLSCILFVLFSMIGLLYLYFYFTEPPGSEQAQWAGFFSVVVVIFGLFAIAVVWLWYLVVRLCRGLPYQRRARMHRKG